MSFLNNIGVVWYNLYCNSHIFDSDTYIAAKWWPVMSSLRFLPREATRIILHTERWSVVIDHFRLVNQQSSVSSIIPSWNVLGIVCSRVCTWPSFCHYTCKGNLTVNFLSIRMRSIDAPWKREQSTTMQPQLPCRIFAAGRGLPCFSAHTLSAYRVQCNPLPSSSHRGKMV